MAVILLKYAFKQNTQTYLYYLYMPTTSCSLTFIFQGPSETTIINVILF